MGFPTIERTTFATLPRAMQREGVLLLVEDGRSSWEIGRLTGLCLDGLVDLVDVPVVPYWHPDMVQEGSL